MRRWRSIRHHRGVPSDRQKGLVMDGSHFHIVTRRRFGAALPAALGAAWGLADPGRARKKRRKRRCPPPPNLCPQRGCCECRIAGGQSAQCTLVDATDETALTAACAAFCPQGTQPSVFNAADDRVNFCGVDNFCTQVACPAPL
jgi:hypothetical protein